MKTFKKLFSVSAIVALLGTLAPMYAFGATYSTEMVQAYDYAHQKGITTMSSIDNADMNGNLTRIALAKMISKYAMEVKGLTPDTTKDCTFPDVSAALDEQYNNGVTLACQLGLMGQGIEKFNPNGIVTRAEFGTTFSRVLNADDADKLAEMNAADPYYKEHLNFLKEEGIMNNISDPAMKEVRGYVMIMMMRSDEGYTPITGCDATEIMNCLLLEGDAYDACMAACSNENNEEEEVLGNAEVTVSAKAEASQDVALNAVNKKIGTVTLKASSESDAIVSTLVINHSGLGDAKTVQLQLYKDGKSVSSKKAMGSNNTVTLKMSPALTIKAGSSITLDVMASITAGANANDTHNFAVESVNIANGKATGTPAKLGTIRTTSYLVGTTKVTVTKKNDITAGDSNKLFASVKITTTAKSNINGFTLSLNDTLNGGAAVADVDMDEVLTNVKAYINNKEVGKVTVNEDGIVVSDLDLSKNSNESVTVDLKGDGIYVGPTGKIAFVVKANDVAATETATDENMANAVSNIVDVNLQGVNLTITKLTKEAKTYAAGTNDVELFSAKVTSDIDFDVTDYTIVIAPATAYCTEDNTAAGKATCEAGTKATISVAAGTHAAIAADTVFNIGGVNYVAAASAADAAITLTQQTATNVAANSLDPATVRTAVGITAGTPAVTNTKGVTAGEWGYFPIFDKVTVLVDGVDTEITDTTTATVAFGKDDSFSVGPNNSATIKVLGDVKSELPAYILANPETYTVTLNIRKVTNSETDKSIDLVAQGTVKSRLGDTVKIQNGTYTLTKTDSAPVSKTVLQGTEATISYFDVKTKAEDGILNSVTLTLAGNHNAGNFSAFATEVTLMKGDTEVKTIDDAATLNSTTLTFGDLSESLTEDTASSFTVKVTLNNDAAVLTKNIQANITTVVKNNAGIALTAAAALPGKTYQIVKAMPTVTLTKDGEYVLVNVVNNSDKALKLNELGLKVTNNVIGNEGGTVTWGADIAVLDGKGGTAIGNAGEQTAPGTLTLDLTTDDGTNPVVNSVPANSSLSFVIEMDSNVTLSSDYYEVAKKSITFQYDNGAGGWIATAVTENY